MEQLRAFWESTNDYVLVGLGILLFVGWIYGIGRIFLRRFGVMSTLPADAPNYRDPGRNTVAFLMLIFFGLLVWMSIGAFFADEFQIAILTLLFSVLVGLGAWRVYTRPEYKITNRLRAPEDTSPKTVDEVVDGDWNHRL